MVRIAVAVVTLLLAGRVAGSRPEERTRRDWASVTIVNKTDYPFLYDAVVYPCPPDATSCEGVFLAAGEITARGRFKVLGFDGEELFMPRDADWSFTFTHGPDLGCMTGPIQNRRYNSKGELVRRPPKRWTVRFRKADHLDCVE